MRRRRNLPSIRKRITLGFWGLLLAVFVLVMVAFNMIVENYIRMQAVNQLSNAQTLVNHNVVRPRQGPPPEQAEFNGFMQQVSGAVRRAVFVKQVQAMVVTQDATLYEPERPEESDAQNLSVQMEQENAEHAAVLAQMNAQHADFQSDAMQRLSTKAGLYYWIATPLTMREGTTQKQEENPLRLVLYLDMTDVRTLSETINRVLLIVLGAAMGLSFLLSILLSSRLTKPIRELSGFANALGRNDYAPRELPVHDRELVELRDAMNHAAQQLGSYDREQRTFFQNVSHELRTPLMSIKGYAEGIEVGVFEDAAQAAKVIGGETDHLTDLVEDLLYLSKVDTITPNAEKTACDMRELLSNCAQSLNGIALKTQKKIVFDFAEEPVVANVEEKHMARALTNVLSNALRYADAQVVIRCKVEGKEAVLSIEDDGAGIAPEDLPRLFDRFYKGKGGKHGIGLSIVQTVVQRHNGQVDAGNMERGAIFTIRLPLA